MIRDRNIICIANRWDYDPTSKHQVMKLLSRHNRIVWVNYRGSRRPRASRADLAAAMRTVRAAFSGVQPVAESIVQTTPLVVPGARHVALKAMNRHLLVSRIRRVLRRLPAAPVQVWTFAPDVDFLAGKFGEECFLYYCVDEYSAFEDFDGEAIRAAEERLIERADLVITTSAALQTSKQRLHPETHLVRHGVDVGHFARAVDRGLPQPADLAGVPRPLYGFFGLMHHWFDVELLVEVARARPSASFVLIGDCHADARGLASVPNVYLLGRRDYGELPAYCAAFDAALLPFRINRMTRNINPIKLREYLAAGLPVISTPLPEAVRYAPDVLVADDCESFARQCDWAITLDNAAARRQRSARVAGESWEAVVERLSGLVESVIQSKDSRCVPAEAAVAGLGAEPCVSTGGFSAAGTAQ
ncbi:MAG TPA: glycosyltransferase [Phycisphaerae bacterium]|nr:glycosyltransferase [Phycisphaerae bacterium]